MTKRDLINKIITNDEVIAILEQMDESPEKRHLYKDLRHLIIDILQDIIARQDWGHLDEYFSSVVLWFYENDYDLYSDLDKATRGHIIKSHRNDCNEEELYD